MLKKFLFEERGQSMALFAISLVALIGFAGLAIDGGRLYMARSQLQKAVDAAALAGADVILKDIKNGNPVNFKNVTKAVSDFSEGNYPEGSYSYDPDQYGSNAVEVSGSEDVNLLLMPVLPGINKSSMVPAKARVRIGNVTKVAPGVVIPVGINFDILKDPEDPTGTNLQYGVQLQITSTPGTGVNGYYGYLDFMSIPNTICSNKGADALNKFITGDCKASVWVDLLIDQESGQNTGQADKAISNMEGQIVYVPIVTGPINGQYKVEGFAAMELIDYVTQDEFNKRNKQGPEPHTIVAKFLHIAVDGEVGETKYDYGVYDSKLEL